MNQKQTWHSLAALAQFPFYNAHHRDSFNAQTWRLVHDDEVRVQWFAIFESACLRETRSDPVALHNGPLMGKSPVGGAGDEHSGHAPDADAGGQEGRLGRGHAALESEVDEVHEGHVVRERDEEVRQAQPAKPRMLKQR
jgi:hypothetical protein